MPPLVYYWKVEYADGSVSEQYNKDGIEQLWGSVNVSKIKNFSWLPFSKEQEKLINTHYADCVKATGNKPFTIALEPGEEIIAFRRNFITSKGERWVVYCSGTNKRTVTGLNEKGETVEDLA